MRVIVFITSRPISSINILLQPHSIEERFIVASGVSGVTVITEIITKILCL